MLVIRRFGAWNLKVGRRPQVVVDEVLRLLEEQDLDVLNICEAAGYVELLAKSLPDEYGLAWFDTDVSARDSAVIFRRGSTVPHRPQLHRLGGLRWERKPGRPGLHRPRSAVSQLVDGVRDLAVHLPPGPFGPRFPLRRLAFIAAAHRVRQLTRSWPAFVLMGDWNMPKSVPGSFLRPSPAWIARKLGARITGDGIDYVVSRGVWVGDFRRLVGFGNSDHWPIVVQVQL